MDYSALTHIPLFGQITPDELEGIFNELNIHENSFKKGEILALQDEPANRLIILLKGSVKAEMTDPSGKVVKVEDIEAPNPLAVLFLFGRDNRFPVQATAREHVEAVVIPKQSILKMLSMNETILKNYLDISADFASRLSRKLHFMSFRTIRQKTAMYLLHLRCAQAVFSHESALFFHDLTDREPSPYSITVKTGYNPASLQADGIKVYTIKKELHDVGIVTMNTPFGNPVPVYDMERTICDLIRSRSGIEMQTFQDALKQYAKRKDKDLRKLMRYAQMFRVEKLLRQYLEVLL